MPPVAAPGRHGRGWQPGARWRNQQSAAATRPSHHCWHLGCVVQSAGTCAQVDSALLPPVWTAGWTEPSPAGSWQHPDTPERECLTKAAQGVPCAFTTSLPTMHLVHSHSPLTSRFVQRLHSSTHRAGPARTRGGAPAVRGRVRATRGSDEQRLLAIVGGPLSIEWCAASKHAQARAALAASSRLVWTPPGGSVVPARPGPMTGCHHRNEPCILVITARNCGCSIPRLQHRRVEQRLRTASPGGLRPGPSRPSGRGAGAGCIGPHAVADRRGPGQRLVCSSRHAVPCKSRSSGNAGCRFRAGTRCVRKDQSSRDRTSCPRAPQTQHCIIQCTDRQYRPLP
jgi:hypothetical protein